MRYCRNCRMWNRDWPLRCRYCAASLEGRLCRRNHINPASRDLVFCGECGEPLSKKYGGGFSVRPYLVATAVVSVTVAAVSLLLLSGKEPSVVTALICLVVLFVGFRVAFRILPAPV
jgi:hypothetical protein